MNYVDLFCLATLFYFFIMGLIRGFIKEVLAITGLFLAIFVCYYFGDILTTHASSVINSEFTRPTTYILTFIAILLLTKWLAAGLTKLSKAAALGVINRALGGLFGLVKAITVLMVIASVYNYVDTNFAFTTPNSISNSRAINVINSLINSVYQILNQELL